MADKHLLLCVSTDALYQKTLAFSLKKNRADLKLHELTPLEVDSELKTFDTDTIATIIIDADVQGTSYQNGIQLIQRLRAIHRLCCSIILLSYERESHASIVAYPGHFFLSRPFRLSEWQTTVEKARMKQLSEAELEDVIRYACRLSEMVNAFQNRMNHGLGHIHANVRFAFNGIRPEGNLSGALKQLQNQQQSHSFMDVKLSFEGRFESEVGQIEEILNQTQRFIHEAQEVVEIPTSAAYNRIKHQVNEDTEANPFVAARNRISAILGRIQGELSI